MHVNYQYTLSKAAMRPSGRGMAILDYGCGEGEVVEEGLKMGLTIYGAEAFYDGSSAKAAIEKKRLLGHAVRMIENGVIPFEDQRFDLVISNMVFEHVEDLDGVLKEIYRVLKPGGQLLCLFPCKESLREGHCGLPLIHWFPKESRFRFYYAVALRSIGFGTFKDERPIRRWVTDHLAWLDKFVHLRDRASVCVTFNKYFSVSFIESDYFSFRLAAQGRMFASRVVRWRYVQPLVRELSRRVAALVIVATKTPALATRRGTDESVDHASLQGQLVS
jgi:ubiquinone/menaquinone biosynthesis C-methylase UbiE